MNSLLSLLAVLAAVVGVRAADAPGLVNGHPPDLKTLKSGDAAPNFDLLGTDGKKHKLPSTSAAKPSSSSSPRTTARPRTASSVASRSSMRNIRARA